ncbi:MFS transporter [Gracilibacillus phocaeensis]|uniref:MFS transporter n=1 Tax=Gracilibacillus phocaeensis TaxID=2042304 RepID=UPI002570A4D8|nr:MFS transporter [Gracilibacillus phocaeensis]
MFPIHSAKRKHNVVIIALVTACCILGDSMLYIALPIYWREAGLDGVWQVGVLLAVNRFIRLPLNPFVGWLYEKMSLKIGLLFAVILSVMTTAGYGLVKGFLAWLILRCIWGLAWSFLRIGGLSTVAVYGEQHKQGEAMGLYNGLYRMGSLVGMLVGGVLTPFLGLTWISLSFGLVSGIGVVILGVFFQNEASLSKTKSTDRKKGILGLDILKDYTLIMSSSFVVTFIIQGVLMATLSSLIIYHFGEEVEILNVVIAASALSGILQALRWMWEPFLATRVGIWSDGSKGRKPFFIGSLLLGSIGLPMLAFSSIPLIWIFFTLCVLLTSTALTTLMDAMAGDRSHEAGTVRFFTYYTVVQDTGAAFGPFVGYLLLSLTFGYEMLYIGCAVLLLVLAVGWFIQFKKEKQQVSIL